MTLIERHPRAWRVFALAMLAMLGAGVLSLGQAEHFADAEPERALAWWADHPHALLRRAESQAQDPSQAADAAETARKALAANPLEGRAHRVLGELVAAADPELAAAHYRRAAARAPADVASRAWLFDRYLGSGNAAEAMPHLDAILRVRPTAVVPLERLLLALAADPDTQPVFAETLASAPPWRARVLVAIGQRAENVDAVYPLFDRLRRSPGGLSAPEREAWLERLVREDRWGAAYLTWAAMLPPERVVGLGNIYNGGFELAPGGGFDWRLRRVAGARIDRAAGSGVGGDYALRIAFADRRVPFAHVEQWLALAPGRYRLSGRARADDLRSGRGLVWGVRCAGSGAWIGEGPALSGQRDWHDFAFEFEVPAAGCAGQRLLLRLPARIVAEQRIGGLAWYDDLRIVRQSALPAR